MQLRDYQEMAIEAVRDSFRAGHRRTLLVSPTGSGKCYGKGTPILMYDGTIKAVEDIEVGDQLMGPDSTPRRVESLARGREEMFRVTPVKGDPFECNRSHILCLDITPAKKGDQPQQVTMSVDEYLGQSNYFKHRAKLWRTGVDFHCTNVRLDWIPPYQMGLWLGDGSTLAPEVSCPDQKVLDGWAELADLHPDRLRAVWLEPEDRVRSVRLSRINGTQQENLISQYLRGLGLMGDDRFIPRLYKIASREDRLALLAGLIDTDGHLHNGYYEISTKYESLCNDILFLARSLGFAAYANAEVKSCQTGASGIYHRITISGDIDQIPCRVSRKQAQPRQQIKRVNVTGFSVESLGEGDYYGFMLSGPDRMHLLGDFTVGHNTVIFSYVAAGVAKNGKRVLIIAHRRELLRQISSALTRAGVKHGMLTGGSTGIPPQHVIVASVFTLANRLKHFPAPDLIVGDEAHHFTPDSSWGKVVSAFPKALVLGVTATPERLDGKGLGSLFDDMVIGPTVAELTEQEYLSPADVYAPSRPDMGGVHTRMGDYVKSELEQAMDRPSITGSAVAHYTKLTPGRKAIAFCVSVKHAVDVAEDFRKAGYAAYHIDGGMKERERDQVLKDFESGKIQVLTSCDLVSEGFDLPAVEVAILLRPTQSLSLYLQQCGRAIRPAPGKEKTYIFDHAGNTARHGFIDEPREWTLDGDIIRRRKAEAKEKVPEIRTCPDCFAMHPPVPICPKCGHVYKVKSRKIQHIDGELVQLSHAGEARAAMEERDWKRRFDVLTAVGRKRGYKQPKQWAFNVICGQEATRLAKSRNANRTTNGLTAEERQRIWTLTMGKNAV